MDQIDVRARSRAAPEVVWSVLADSGSWAEWAPFDEIVVVEGHQLGEVRRVRAGRITTRERVVGFEPPHRYVYEIVSGLPVRDYVAEVLLSATADGGTDLHWRARFRARIPGTGWALKRAIERAIARAARALVKRADEVA